MAKIDPFEKCTAEYDAWFEKNDLAYLSELMAVKNQLPQYGTGIEIGVGTGRFAAPLGIEWGLEPSPQMERIARRRGIRVVIGTAERLPFADNLFDYALMVTTICFLDDIEVAFNEVRRILKESGKFIIGFIDRESPLGCRYEKHKKDNEFYRIAKFYSVDEVMAHLDRTGFQPADIIQTIFHSLSDIHKIENPTDGHGEGSFVVIRAEKEE
jgi:SAM-dependent methyltransferase